MESVARENSGAINDYKVVIEKSTVPVYTSDWARKIMLRNGTAADTFDVASNPEFLREGSAVTDFLYPDRIVVGADTERCAQVLVSRKTSWRSFRGAGVWVRISFTGRGHTD